MRRTLAFCARLMSEYIYYVLNVLKINSVSYDRTDELFFVIHFKSVIFILNSFLILRGWEIKFTSNPEFCGPAPYVQFTINVPFNVINEIIREHPRKLEYLNIMKKYHRNQMLADAFYSRSIFQTSQTDTRSVNGVVISLCNNSIFFPPPLPPSPIQIINKQRTRTKVFAPYNSYV